MAAVSSRHRRSLLQQHNFEFVKEHTILDYPEYEFNIEEHRREDGSQFLFAHFRFKTKKVTRELLKKILAEWKVFRQCVTAPIYAGYFTDGDIETWKKFVGLLGFKPTSFTIPLNNGVERPLYIHTVSNDQIIHKHVVADLPVGSAEHGAHHRDERRHEGVRRGQREQSASAH